MKEMMKLFPLNNYVVIQKLSVKNTTESGIYLGEAVQDFSRAKVVAISDTIDQVNATNSKLSVGNVLIIRWSTALQIKGDMYAVDLKDIVSKVEE